MSAAAQLIAASIAVQLGGELQSIEERGVGVVAVVVVGSTPWRVQLDPLDRRSGIIGESLRVLGSCEHGVDLDRDFCPRGCRV